MADRYQEAGYSRRLRLRDEVDRLTWVEDQAEALAGQWEKEAQELTAVTTAGLEATHLAALSQARAEALGQAARALRDVTAASRAPGGPPVDHMAWARYHLERHERKAGGGQ